MPTEEKRASVASEHCPSGIKAEKRVMHHAEAKLCADRVPFVHGRIFAGIINPKGGIACHT